VIVDGDLCVAVVDRQVALSARIYDRPSGRIGIFAGEGSATVVEFDVRQRTDN
jgi:beta-fructofuranosidase